MWTEAVLIHLILTLFWIVLTVWIARNMTMKAWQDFLDSLSTSGGNVVTLFLCSVGSGLLWWTVYNQHGADGQAVMATFGIFGGFTGALLQAQKGNASRQQMMDRVGATAPDPATVAREATREAPKNQDTVNAAVLAAAKAPAEKTTHLGSFPL